MKNIHKILRKIIKIIKLLFFHPIKLTNFLKLIICYSFQIRYAKTKPSFLMIEPCNYCNLQCSSCPVAHKITDKKKGDMPFSTFKNIIDEVGDCLFYIILYNWGEPFLNNNFLKMVEYAKDKDIAVTTSTNGHFIDNQQIAEKIVKSGLDNIVVSVDGMNQIVYEKYRIGGNLKKVIKGINLLSSAKKKLKKNNPEIVFQVVINKYNEYQLPGFYEFAKKQGVDRLKLKTYSYFYNKNELKFFVPKNSNLSRYGFNIKETKGCKDIWLGMNINYDGNVVPCCYDMFEEYKLGNIFKDGGVIKIWNSDKFSDFRRVILKNKKNINICKECDTLRIIKNIEI